MKHVRLMAALEVSGVLATSWPHVVSKDTVNSFFFLSVSVGCDDLVDLHSSSPPPPPCQGSPTPDDHPAGPG